MSVSQFAWIITLIILVIFAVIFIIICKKTSPRENNYSEIQQQAYRYRNVLFIVILLAGIPIAGLTLSNLPYSANHSINGDMVSVDVKAYQWRWEISQTNLPVGIPIVFNVTSGDVNHGFGIYNEKLELLNQTQAMPNYINKLVHVFDQPGSYKILCLEYCGLAHHAMVAELTIMRRTK